MSADSISLFRLGNIFKRASPAQPKTLYAIPSIETIRHEKRYGEILMFDAER